MQNAKIKMSLRGNEMTEAIPLDVGKLKNVGAQFIEPENNLEVEG